jgi:hypothetical protein
MRNEDEENLVGTRRGNSGTSSSASAGVGVAPSLAKKSSLTLSRHGLGKLMGSNALIDFLTICCAICVTSG